MGRVGVELDEEVDTGVARQAVIDKFGPVRQVGPGLWAELEFETVRPAPRRKIGVTLDGARILRLIWEGGPEAPDLSKII